MNHPKITLIAAMSNNRAIGLNNALPWPEPIPADWEHLAQVSKGKKMIMGRKSYDNPHRVSSQAGNYVITRQKNYKVESNFIVSHSLDEALRSCQGEKEVFVIGGQQIFEQAIEKADKIYLTLVHKTFHGDTFFPDFEHLPFEATSRQKFDISLDAPYPMEIITYERR